MLEQSAGTPGVIVLHKEPKIDHPGRLGDPSSLLSVGVSDPPAVI